MLAKGQMPGATPKADAMALLPDGTKCHKVERMGIRGYVIRLPDGREIAGAGNSQSAWDKAHSWALRNMPPNATELTGDPLAASPATGGSDVE